MIKNIKIILLIIKNNELNRLIQYLIIAFYFIFNFISLYFY